MPKTWGPRKLTAPSHGHPFPSVVGAKWQFKGLPGSGPSLLAYLGNFMGAGSSHAHKCLGNQPAPRQPSCWQPSWKQTYSIEAFVWGHISSPNVHSSSGLRFAFSKACRHTQVGNQAGNSLQITIRGESGEGRAQGASWPPESGWGQAILLVRAGRGEVGENHTHSVFAGTKMAPSRRSVPSTSSWPSLIYTVPTASCSSLWYCDF